MKDAILNFIENTPIKRSKNGKNYTLPSNFKVLIFICKLLNNLVYKLFYGLFYEKKWKVALSNENIKFDRNNILKEKSFKDFFIAPKYIFYADPFFSHDLKKIRLEALVNQSGLGDIVEFDIDFPGKLKELFSGNHYSYPFSFEKDGEEFILPEVASHSNQYFCKILDGDCNSKHLGDSFYLKGFENKRIVDGTLFQHENYWYVFFGDKSNAHTVLHLWCATSLESDFSPHPKSPICLSPSSARMAGRIVCDENGLYRFGQNNSKGYGESITISKIDVLSPVNYQEKICGSVSIDYKKGPHTVDVDHIHKRILIDYYQDEFSLFAGIRRLKARLSGRKS